MLERLNILVSLGTLGRKCAKVLRPDWDVFLDSGAFTNFKTGRDVVTLESYTDFLGEYGAKFWRYLSLDRIGDPAGSASNLAALRARGFAPVPVFQRGAPLSELATMAGESDLVALGGIAGALWRSHTAEYIANAVAVARRLGTKAHLLGVGNQATLSSLRPYSADSSDYSLGNRVARTRLWDPKTRTHVAVGRTMKLTRPVVALLDSYQATPKDITTYDWWTGKLRMRGVMRVSAWSTFRFVEHLGKLGVRYFVAINDPDVWILRDIWDEYVAARAA